MTAEEKLKEVYKSTADERIEYQERYVELSPEHIDLIANLVVERLSNKVGND